MIKTSQVGFVSVMTMQIIVCIKQVPGTSEVDIDEETGVLKREGIDSKMNPFDLFAIETALTIRETYREDAKITAISMGPPQAEAVLKEAYMMGIDDGYLLTDRKFAGADCLATAYTLSQGIKKIGIPNLIICGKQTTDGDTAQVGSEIAEFLNIPHVTNVIKIIKITEHSIIVELDLPTMVQVAEIPFPCLIAVDKDIFQPRLPSFKLKVLTQHREIKKLSIKDFEDQNTNNYGLNGSPTQVQKVFPPEANTDQLVWQEDEEKLVEKLFKVLSEKKFI